MAPAVAAIGFALAGWAVVGVDNNPDNTRDYPFPVVHMERVGRLTPLVRKRGSGVRRDQRLAAMLQGRLRNCRRNTAVKARKADEHNDLLTPTLDLLRRMSIPWVVENVVGARGHDAGDHQTARRHVRVRRSSPAVCLRSNVLLLAPTAAPANRTPWRLRRQARRPPPVAGTGPGTMARRPFRNSRSFAHRHTFEEAHDAMGMSRGPIMARPHPKQYRRRTPNTSARSCCNTSFATTTTPKPT